MEQQSMVDILVIWRGKHMNVEINANANVREFGLKLQKLTRVRPDTMRLLVPQSSSKGSKLLHPFLDEHSSSTLGEAAILQGKPIRMMGAFNDEIEEVSLNSKMLDQRIAGFDEEEKRLRLRSERPHASLRLPQGAYIFCDFRTLHIPGVELNPQASEALKRMHMLACDPGIIAIMNKHRWRVGIMTEMAPEGYVGISPKCLLGFNKNYGEEISLRLRTDDLKGFRKYESVKKTLLHELAHMVYSDHDANFYALNKQLNQEAANLDWTKSKGNTLSGRKNSDHYEDELLVGSTSDNTGKTLGGQRSSLLTTARGSSVAAAYNRLLNASISSLEGSQVQESIHMDRMTEDAHFLSKKQIYNARIEPTSDNTEKKDKSDKSGKDIIEPDPDDVLVTVEDDMQVDMLVDITEKPLSTSSIKSEDVFESDSDDVLVGGAMECFVEPDPDDLKDVEALESCEETDSKVAGLTKLDLYPGVVVEPDPDDFESVQSKCLFLEKTHKELDPVDSHVGEALDCCGEPDPDDSRSKALDDGNVEMPQKEPDPDECVTLKSLSEPGAHMDPVDSRENENVNAEPDPDDSIVVINDQELRSIEESVSVICTRLHKAIEMLRSELTSIMVTSALQTLFKIIRNVLDHPDDVKFRRLRKANPLFQRNVVNYKAAMEFLAVVGFYEDLIADEAGRAETYLVLKRNDPGLLWLAKSSLEASLA